MDRRQALTLVGTMAGYLYGKPVAGQSSVMGLVLDGVEVIVVQYRGRRVAMSPSEVLDALGAGVQMQMQQYPRGK
jgi:hypothetical protein